MERDHFKEGRDVLGAVRNLNGVAAEGGDLGVGLVDDGDDLGALLLHVAEEVDGLFVAQQGVGGVGVAGGQDDERGVRVYQGVGAVFELAGGVAFGLDVGRLLELERAFAGDGVVDAAAEEEEGLRGLKGAGEGCDLGLPLGERRGHGFGDGVEVVEMRFDDGAGHAAADAGGEEGEEGEDDHLGGEAFGGGDGALGSGHGGERTVGHLRHGGVVVVGDGDGGGAAGGGLAEGFGGVGGFAGLGDDHEAGIFEGLSGAVDVLAGVLDVDGDAGEVFEEDFADEASVAAGAAGGDEQALLADEGLARGEEGGFAEAVAVGVGGQGFGDGVGLLVDLAEHRVGEGLVLGERQKVCPPGQV